jgi:hypothetical protein
VSLTDWLRLRLGRRRPLVAIPPPSPDPGRLTEARREATRADEELQRVRRQDPRVRSMEERAVRIHQENNLGPAFMRVLGGRSA